MDTMNFSDPDNLKDVVPPHVVEGGYSNVSEYIGALIRAGQKDKAKEVLEAEILKGIDSGPPEPWTDEDMADIRAEVLRRHEARMAQRNVKG